MKGINYITNDKGKKTAVVIDMDLYAEYLEDFLDGVEAESRKNESNVTLEDVKKRLVMEGKL